MNSDHKEFTLPSVNWTQYYTLMARQLTFCFLTRGKNFERPRDYFLCRVHVEAGCTTWWCVYVKLDKQCDNMYVCIYIYTNKQDCKYCGVTSMVGLNGTPEMEIHINIKLWWKKLKEGMEDGMKFNFMSCHQHTSTVYGSVSDC